jgi:antitoxin VapB
MALSIKSAEADRLARELAATTGESLTEAVTRALEERLARARRRPAARDVELDAIWRRAARIPRRDLRSDDELLGYDAEGGFG